MKILCFDGNSIINRAFYAIKMLTTKDGRYTNGIYGFMNIFLKVLDSENPDAVVIAFDTPAKTFRKEMYAEYKANRKGMPPELAEQMPILKELIVLLGYSEIGVDGYEADDVLGTLSRLSSENGWECVIATGDRDSLQLITNNTKVLLTTTQFGRGETTALGVEEIENKYGIGPRQLIDVKALMGDSSDNIPGIAGIGEKTALNLIRSFSSLDNIYNNIDSDLISETVRKRLIAGKETAYLCKKLVEINCYVPIDGNLMSYVKNEGSPDEAYKLLANLEMHTLIDRLGIKSEKLEGSETGSAAIECVELSTLTRNSEDDFKSVGVYSCEEEFYLTENNKLFRVDKALLLKILKNPNIEKICVDSKRIFDSIPYIDFECKNVVFDLVLAGYLLNPSSNDYSIMKLASEFDIKPDFENDEIPEMGYVIPLYSDLKKRLESEEMLELLEDIEIPLARVLSDMEKTGFRVDSKGIENFGLELKKNISVEEEKIFEIVGYEFNINSPKQLSKALFEDLGLPHGRKTKTGYSTDAEVLENLRGKHEVIDHILDYRSYQKLNSTYVEGLLKTVDKNNRIHSVFKQAETRTGRISSTNPNLQNIPIRTELGSRIREFFIADEGNLLIDADYSQIELRVLAHLSNDEKMIEAFSENRDIHTETAGEIFGVPRKMVNDELRRRAKAVNFGIVYGIGAYSLAKDVGVSVYEADEYIKGYMNTYKGVSEYLEKTVAKAQDEGYVKTLFNRRRKLPELASSNRITKAFGKRLAMNTPIQGTAADIIKIAMIRVHERLKSEKLNARLILQVHDELIIECSYSDSDKVAKLLKEEMENAVNLTVPLSVSIKKGNNWYDAG
ncbi:MAG: DNA polymerase I [Ruminococcaceae bacterium]|nr:DNA polymerase I [Oscillospiraceae bacterium]